jgi:hypothetical protein
MKLERYLLITAMAATVGCGGTSDDPGPGDPAVDGGGAVDEADAAVTDPSLADEIESDVIGHYVLRTQTAAMMNLPIVGETESITTAIGIAEVVRVGDRFDVTESGCHVDSSAGDAVTTVIPDVIPRSAEPMTTALAFDRQGDVITWTRASRVTLIGVDLANPSTDMLPTDAMDSRVFDQDEDGNPGVTVSLEGIASGDIYVVQRNTAAYYDGTLDAAGSLTALVDANNEQVVIGATNPLLQQQIPADPHPDPTMNNIALARLSEAYDCDRAVSEASTLFP